MKIGDKVQLKSDNYPDYFVEKVNGHKIKEIITVNNQPVADDHGILISRAFLKVKNKIPPILNVCILDNGEKIPATSIKIATSESMNMNLTENQIKRIKPLLTKLVNEVKQELKEGQYNKPIRVGQSTITFGDETVKITAQNSSIVLTYEDAHKVANYLKSFAEPPEDINNQRGK